MKSYWKQKKRLLVTSIIFLLLGQTSEAALLGTNLSIETVFQQTSTSAVETVGFLTTATVVEPGVEFPSLAATEVINPPLGLQVVDVSVNAGDGFLEIDFDNVTHTSFSPAFFNGYVFTFDSSVVVDIASATIDTSVTTLGLEQSDLTFSGNQLTVNVEGLPFNTPTFARIELTSTNGPCGDLLNVPPAIYEKSSGKLNIPAVIADGKCYSLELDCTPGVSIEFIDACTKSSIGELVPWLIASNYQTEFDQQVNNGFYPIEVEGRNFNGESQFRGKFVPIPPNPFLFNSIHGHEKGSYEGLNTNLLSQGYTQIHLQTFVNSMGITLYQATWEKRD